MIDQSKSTLNKLKALNDRIIFKFVQETVGGKFVEKTKSNFVIIEGADKQLKAPRWGIAYKVGKDVSEDIKEGTYILIENLMWTEHVVFEGEKMWTTAEEKVIAVSDEPVDTL